MGQYDSDTRGDDMLKLNPFELCDIFHVNYETLLHHLETLNLGSLGGLHFFTLNSPKLSRPGSWNEPHLLKLIPERKKFRVNVADIEQKSCNTRFLFFK